MTSESSVFAKLKNFGTQVSITKANLERAKKVKEQENWDKVLQELAHEMTQAQAYGIDHFLVCVDTLTSEQRAELIKKVKETDSKLSVQVKHHTLRDSSEGDYLEVKITS